MKITPLFNRRKVTVIAGGLMLAVIGFISPSFTFRPTMVTIWSQLGISENTGTENIRKSFLEGYLYTYGAAAAKKVAIGDRVALTNDVLRYCKEFVGSAGFKKDYDIARAQNKPVKPQDPKTKSQIQTERIAELNTSIEEGEKSMKTLPPDLIAPFKEMQQMFRDQIKDYENPESEMLNMLFEGEQFNYKNAMQQFEDQTKTWEKEYPADHMKMVKTRLETFLQVTADVDYSAALREEYHVKKFVNPVYERKSAEWKMAYRSGKPVVDAARSFAKQWLTEIN